MMEIIELCKYLDIRKVKKGLGPIPLELLSFVILNGFCLCIDSAYARKSTYTTAFAETN